MLFVAQTRSRCGCSRKDTLDFTNIGTSRRASGHWERGLRSAVVGMLASCTCVLRATPSSSTSSCASIAMASGSSSSARSPGTMAASLSDQRGRGWVFVSPT